MKIVLDTVTKQAICPKEFFETVRNINDANKLTGASKEVSSKDYLQKVIEDCSGVIINKSDMTKKRTVKKK